MVRFSILPVAAVAVTILGAEAGPCRPITTAVTSLPETSSMVAPDTTVTSLDATTTISSGATTVTTLVEITSTAPAESTTTTQEPACAETQLLVNPSFDDIASSKAPWLGGGWKSASQNLAIGAENVAEADVELSISCGGEYNQIAVNMDDITLTQICDPEL